MGTQTRALLGLVMILKNEADNIERTIASVAGVVDSVLVLDTGSTDHTQDVVLQACRAAGLRLFLHEEPFIDFATTRNRANELYLAEGEACPEFLLMLSGDETLVGGKALRDFLETQRNTAVGAYNTTIELGESVWLYPRILRARAGWRYVGVVHEVPMGPDGDTTGPAVEGVAVLHTVTDEKKRNSRLWLYDRPMLEKVLVDLEQPPELHANALFLLGQTCDQIANELGPSDPAGEWVSHKLAAMGYYRRRAEMESLFAEINGVDLQAHEDKASYSIFSYFRIANEVGLYDPEETLKRLEPIAAYNPRIPALRYLIAVMASRSEAHIERAIDLCEKASRIALECKRAPLHIPFDTRIAWLSWLLAIEVAKHTERPEMVPDLARKGLDAGGPAEVFSKYLG